ncbi:MAG: biotin/lipoyl-binding protein, partial [Gammaproteobacteria bacterium]|nr:biotin/lipoyl-binding protein [Gammaproteobacteria bacterium]
MSIQEIRVPDIGDFSDVGIIEVLVSPGDSVSEEDALITLESDKASMDVPSPVGGRVEEIKVKVGDKVSEGDVIVLMEAADAASAAGPAATEIVSQPAATTAPPGPARGEIVSFARVYASPAVRRIARERNIDL